jgi:hypothetical protein
MSKFRLKWEGTWVNTYAVMSNGVEIRVKFLHGSKSWGMYVDGELRGKQPTGSDGMGRARAKDKVKNWYGHNARPKNKVPCTHCGGTGFMKKE